MISSGTTNPPAEVGINVIICSFRKIYSGNGKKNKKL
jgi:hypothetical protein